MIASKKVVNDAAEYPTITRCIVKPSNAVVVAGRAWLNAPESKRKVTNDRHAAQYPALVLTHCPAGSTCSSNNLAFYSRSAAKGLLQPVNTSGLPAASSKAVCPGGSFVTASRFSGSIHLCISSSNFSVGVNEVDHVAPGTTLSNAPIA
eukprot:2810866-Rhodomonas_salina.2